MSGNVFGKIFTVTSFGESHGPAIGCVIDGCPPGLVITPEDIQIDLDRRKPGTSRYVTQRKEQDKVEILSGVFEKKTTGAPLMMLIRNIDQRTRDYGNISQVFRPGHADYTYHRKYGFRDYRGGGRQSARETAVRVAAGALAKKWLKEKYGISIRGRMSQLGNIPINFKGWQFVRDNVFFSADPNIVPKLEEFMDKLRKTGDSCGAKLTFVAENMPVGLGEPVYHKLDAAIASAMMGINAVKGVEIGAGFEAVNQKGTEHSDELSPQGFLSNHAGGVLGGISTGQDLIVTIAIKPTSSIRLDQRSINTMGEPVVVNTHGRHDPCVGIRATPIGEAMIALVLMDFALLHRATCGDVDDSLPPIKGIVDPSLSGLETKVVDNPEPDEA